jgi:hypothetical protein
MSPKTGPEVAWHSPKDKGTRPGPRSGHSITVAREKAVVFGGCGIQDGVAGERCAALQHTARSAQPRSR